MCKTVWLPKVFSSLPSLAKCGGDDGRPRLVLCQVAGGSESPKATKQQQQLIRPQSTPSTLEEHGTAKSWLDGPIQGH